MILISPSWEEILYKKIINYAAKCSFPALRHKVLCYKGSPDVNMKSVLCPPVYRYNLRQFSAKVMSSSPRPNKHSKHVQFEKIMTTKENMPPVLSRHTLIKFPETKLESFLGERFKWTRLW